MYWSKKRKRAEDLGSGVKRVKVGDICYSNVQNQMKPMMEAQPYLVEVIIL